MLWRHFLQAFRTDRQLGLRIPTNSQNWSHTSENKERCKRMTRWQWYCAPSLFSACVCLSLFHVFLVFFPLSCSVSRLAWLPEHLPLLRGIRNEQKAGRIAAKWLFLHELCKCCPFLRWRLQEKRTGLLYKTGISMMFSLNWPFLKGYFTPKLKVCHQLFTLMSVETCIIFLGWTNKEEFSRMSIWYFMYNENTQWSKTITSSKKHHIYFFIILFSKHRSEIST